MNIDPMREDAWWESFLWWFFILFSGGIIIGILSGILLKAMFAM